MFGPESRKLEVTATMSTWSLWENARYVWVVVCKNKKAHRHAGAALTYKIPLAETDAVSGMPDISAPFLVKCPNCSGEYRYDPGEVMNVELDVVDSFVPHPLFQDH